MPKISCYNAFQNIKLTALTIYGILSTTRNALNLILSFSPISDSIRQYILRAYQQRLKWLYSHFVEHINLDPWDGPSINN